MLPTLPSRRFLALAWSAAVTLSGLLAAQDSGHPRPAVSKRPNVVFILSDDQGFADIGYHNDKVYSPHLDRLARGGVRFTQSYVMPQCTPTRVALMTGRYPSRFGGAALQASNAPAFPKDTPTLARLFQSAGYETFLCGKWHLGSDPDHGPNHFGFDHSYGSLAGAVGNYDHRYRKGRFADTWHRDHALIEGSENGTHTTDLIAAEAVRIIRTPRDRPFFLYIPFHAVHTPLDERGRFVDQPTARDPRNPQAWRNEDEIPWFHDPAGKIQAEKDPEKRLLLAAVHHLDHAVGQIVAALDATGQRARTLIVFSSDNGPQGSWAGNAYPDDLELTDFNQPLPFRGKKTDVYEGGIHVPGFAHWPGTLAPREESTPIHIVDWFPTFAALLRDRKPTLPPVDGDGTDLTGLLFDRRALPDRTLYWNWNQKTNRWAVRHGDWKLVHYGRKLPAGPEGWQLFQLSADPRERRDLARVHPERAAAMHRRFLLHRKKDHTAENQPAPAARPGSAKRVRRTRRLP